MMIPRPFRLVRPLLLLVLTVVGMPLAGKWLRRPEKVRCAFDGQAIKPLYRVRINDACCSRSFCCIGCAQAWLDRQRRPGESGGGGLKGSLRSSVFVTDEASGREIPQHSAFFVHSPISTNPVTGNRTHVFLERQDAQAHAQAFSGQVLDGPERPFWDADKESGNGPFQSVEGGKP
jgi:hypothetical protein